MKFKPLMAALALSATAFTAPAQAVDGFMISVGATDDDIDFYRVAARLDWDKKWYDQGDWFLGGHYELGLTHLNSDSDVVNTTGAADSLEAISILPVFRFQRNPYGNGIAPFVEAGIGLAYLTEDMIQSESANGVDLGGNFQFEDRLSAGLLFGAKQQYEVSANYYHYSNAGLEDPNDGIDIFSLSFSMWY